MAEWWNQTPVYEFEEPMYGYASNRSSRERHSTPQRSRYDDNLATSSACDLSYRSSRCPARTPRPRSERPNARRRNSYPPAPHVEDEHISLARELGGKRLARVDEEIHNPPAKGDIDQHPILYESSLSASEAASTDTLETILATNYHKPEGRGKAQEEWEARQRQKAEEDRSKERRFVLLPKSDTYSPNSEDNELDYYSDLRKPKTPQIIHERGTPSRERTPEPDLGRRKSRHDLPSLKTDIENSANAPPPLERSPNAYSYKPRIKEDLRPPRNGLLSPDVGSARPRSRGGDHRGGYFDIPKERERERDRERDERRRSRPSTPNGGGGSSRPTTPSFSRASSDFGLHSPSRWQLDPQSAYGSSRRDREGSSRPSSPNTEKSVRPNGNGNGHRRQGSRDTRDARSDDFEKPRKVATSPLPSPRVERDPFKSRRGESFPPVIHQVACSPRPTSPYPDSAYPKPLPSHEIAKTKRNSREHSPSHSTSATMPTIPTPAWPPTFNPPATRLPIHGHLDPPTMGSYRRQSVDIESGHLAPLPPCPRTSPSHGAHDWLTLPRCEGFHICPTCYTSNVEPTQFRSFFVPRPFGLPSGGEGIVCDFGTQPWYRIAWLMLQKNREKDLTLIYRLAEILRTTEECLGPNKAVRDWFGVEDKRTGRLVEEWVACGSCVEVIEAVLPQLEGVFKRRAEFEPFSGYGSDRGYGSGGYGSDRSANGSARRGRKRICDMRFDTENFIHYFDALELVAEQTPRHLGRYLPDMSLFVDVVERVGAIQEGKNRKAAVTSGGATPPRCEGSKELIGANWWCIAQLPELTCCASCFKEVVKPEVENRRAIPRMFEVERRERGSCQLYSPLMRKIFRECCASDEFVALAKAARERKKKEREYREDLEWATRFSGSRREEEEDKAVKRWERYE